MNTVLEAQPPVRLVLYIEENKSCFELVEELLARRNDVRLMHCRSGIEGLAMAVLHMPAVIMLDLHLRDITSMDALCQLQSNPLTTNIPVMGLSSNASPKQITNGLDSGFFRYVPKPFQFSEFLGALESCLSSASSQTYLKGDKSRP